MRADYYGDASFYPASLVQLFLWSKRITRDTSPEIERAMREMTKSRITMRRAFCSMF